MLEIYKSSVMRQTSVDRVKGAFGAVSTHGIGFSSARLTVCKDGDIVALDEGIDTAADIFPDTLLGCFLCEDAIKDEQLLSLRGLNREVGGRRDITGRSAETLGDQVVAGIGRLEGRADADSWTTVSQRIE
jgi:hypothetical protein